MLSEKFLVSSLNFSTAFLNWCNCCTSDAIAAESSFTDGERMCESVKVCVCTF